MTYEEQTLCEQYNDQLLVDSSLVGDMFKHFFSRDVSLFQADAEKRFEETEEELNEANDKYDRWKEYVAGIYTTDEEHDKFQQWVRRMDEKKESLDSDKKAMDFQLIKDDPETDNLSAGQAWYTFLEMYIDRMTPTGWAIAMDALESAHSTKEISWYYFVKCGLALTYRLVRNCPKGGWDNTFYMLKAHNAKYHQKTVSYEDRFYGEMSFDMEAAVDQMAQVRELATLNHMDVQEMYYQVMEQREATGLGLPLEGYSADLDAGEVDKLQTVFQDNWNSPPKGNPEE